MAACILCLVDNLLTPERRIIDIFSEEGAKLNISYIISKHFWLRPNNELCPGQQICLPCWETVREFNQFYQRVAEAHNRLESKVMVLDADLDPLPFEQDPADTKLLDDVLGESFFDSEVKVEMHDLEFLPQIEIIEENTRLSDRAQRAHRRSCHVGESSALKTSLEAKRIKSEDSSRLSVSTDESEPELPLAVLMKVGFKTDSSNEECAEVSTAIDGSIDAIETSTATPPERKRRGRPKKVKQEQQLADPSAPSAENTVKPEMGDSESEAGNSPTFPAADGASGTEDSADSTSETDTDGSWPENEPVERYAEIPKRVVVKPKKYRKRPKPDVPPRRMTREEIDRKNAQQAEYDKVIAQFFEKFVCPRCSLLVQNFGDMRRHFRASHNIDPGYMMCCGRKFHQRKALAEHVYVHWNPDHFKCTTCSRVFQDGRALEVHELTHTNPPEPKEKKVFQCDKCPKSFSTKAAFEYHSFSKHVPKSEFKFTCTECNKKLPTQRKLKDHMKYMHDPESAVICDKCGKQMRSQTNLKKHHQIEHSELPRPAPTPMQCEICGTWLRHLAGLKQHMKTIHEEAGGEHRCHICNKTSTNARALKRHIYHNHECERKFKCTMCEKAFKRPQDLREHTSTHTGEVLYTCPNCPMTFFSNANMYKHRQRLHRAEWETDRKKPVPPNIMQQAVGATAAMKMQQAVGANSAFFAHKHSTQSVAFSQSQINAN